MEMKSPISELCVRDQQTSQVKSEDRFAELSELQLALVGGGIADLING